MHCSRLLKSPAVCASSCRCGLNLDGMRLECITLAETSNGPAHSTSDSRFILRRTAASAFGCAAGLKKMFIRVSTRSIRPEANHACYHCLASPRPSLAVERYLSVSVDDRP